MVVFAKDGDKVSVRNAMNADSSTDVLLVAGMPLNEPLAHYGPFVMNRQKEIHNAIEDYRNGRMGLLGRAFLFVSTPAKESSCSGSSGTK